MRDGELVRRWMHDRFIAELTGQRRPYIAVSGTHEARLQAAIQAIEGRVLARREAGTVRKEVRAREANRR